MAKKASRTQAARYYGLAGVTIALAVMGAVMIPSASSALAYSEKGNSFYYAGRQFGFLAFGLLLMLAMARTDYRKFRLLALPTTLLTIVSLIAVYYVGKQAHGSSRWLPIGPIHFQPSEFAKLAVLFFSASYFEKLGRRIGDWRKLLWPYGFVIAIIAALVYKQPDLGTTSIIVVTAFLTWFLAGGVWWQMMAAAATGLSYVALKVLGEPYQLARLTSFINPWADPRGNGYQIIQSWYALGSGGWTGVGLGLSKQKFGYLPAAHTDFILAVVGEELGLIFTVFIVALFATYVFMGTRIAVTTKDRFGQLLAGGVTAMIGVQAVINIGAVIGYLPITGVPLPFISYGGTSLVVSLLASGLLLSVDTYGKQARQAGPIVASDNMRRGNRRSRVSRVGVG